MTLSLEDTIKMLSVFEDGKSLDMEELFELFSIQDVSFSEFLHRLPTSKKREIEKLFIKSLELYDKSYKG